MTDDKSGQSSSVSRRRLLSLLSTTAVAGLAGCGGQVAQGDGNTTESPATRTTGTGTTDTGTATESTGTENGDARYSGETIPPVPHGAMADSPPTVAAPASGVTNPVLTADDVTDFGAAVDYVADPFMFVEEGEWHMFFEVVNTNRNPDSAIGHATSSDGLEWSYDQIVIEKSNHTSYPFVLKWEGDYYMSPPTGQRVELWKATSFPTDWEKQGNIIEADFYTKDPSFVRWNDRWYLFTDRDNKDVMVYHSDTLSPDGWEPHADNPVVTDRMQATRQGGRPVVVDDSIYLFFQDVEYEYGDEIRSYEVTELTPESYSDQETRQSPVLAGFGSGWNGGKMHHFDPWSLGEGEGWRCSVDGATDEDNRWAIGIYDVPASLGVDQSRVPYDTEQVSGFYSLTKDTNVAVDHSGNANHGMIRGTTATSGGSCPGLQFPADRDRVTFPDPHAAAFDSDSFSVVVEGQLTNPDAPQTLWSYTSMHVDRRIAVRWDPGAQGWQFDIAGTTDRAEPLIESSIEPGTPFQLAITYEAGEGYRIYENGTPITQARDVGSPYHEVCFLTLGATLPGQFPWEGTVNALGLFSTALDEGELADLDDAIC